MIFGGKKKEIEGLKIQLKQLQHQFNELTEEHNNLQGDLNLLDIRMAKELEEKVKLLKEDIIKGGKKLQDSKEELKSIKQEIKKSKDELVATKDIVLLQECGIYDPIYNFNNSQSYKERLEDVRSKQKELITGGDACVATINNIYMDGSEAKGSKLINNIIKLMLTGFNMQTEAIINGIKDTNVRKSIEKIQKLCKSINKSGEIIGISIAERYLDLKVEEASIKYEYELKRAEEKEKAKIEAQILKEQKELERELEENRKKLEKEKKHYLQQLEVLKEETYTKEEIELVQAKIEEITNQIATNDYRIANQKAGYLYIISNDAMEEKIFKIGVTRRLEPEERIDELGNASVPFKFNIHGIIFSQDAFKLESDLHRSFDNFRVNKVNKRKEFFATSLEEIENVLLEQGYDVELDKEIRNDEYILSKEIENSIQSIRDL